MFNSVGYFFFLKGNYSLFFSLKMLQNICMPRHCWGKPPRRNTSGFQDMNILKFEIIQNCPSRVKALGEANKALLRFVSQHVCLKSQACNNWCLCLGMFVSALRRHLWNNGPLDSLNAVWGPLPPSHFSQSASELSVFHLGRNPVS